MCFDVLNYKKIMKALDYKKDYKYSIYILRNINGLSSIKISKQDMKNIKIIINDINDFSKNYKKKSLFPCLYKMRKIFELLDFDKEIIKYIDVGKYINNIKKYDKIWKLICKQKKYKFINTYIL